VISIDHEEISQRLYPREHEQSVLGALLRDNDAIDRVGDLRADHFFDHWHGKIFSAITKLVVAGKPADVITTFEELQKAGSDAQVPSMAYLNDLQQSMPSSATIGRYAVTVRDRAMKRKLIALAHETAGAVPESPEDADVLVDRMSSALELLSRSVVKQEPQLAREGLAQHIDLIDQLYSGDGPVAQSTGLPDLDRKLNGGLRPGNLIVIAGRPKMGKTALAVNISNNIAADGGVSLVASMEMTKPELHNRNLASIGGIPLDHLIDPKQLDEQDWPRLTHAITKIGEMALYMDDQPAMSLLDIRSKAKQVKRRAGKLSVLVIDYLQLMSGPGDNRNAQIESITRGLKALAKELDVPIILLSQLNRKLEERPNKRPMPSDLRDSGSIEQDADIVIFVYRDEVYNPDSPDKGMAEINVALNRQGAPGMVPMVYVGEYTLFKSAVQGWRPQKPDKHSRRKVGFDDE
jgi:replicative DNA helicase